ncbi:MAG: sigma-70 family RNA polymerase sigma factor [Acidimicrobiia bacterium]|nr:sigma-70 family RNA polymerase sigma factor [Acidimicrobiia bacterium]
MLTATLDLTAALKLSRTGDQQAFAGLVREHQAMVYSIGWNFLRDRAQAEDMAQEVFLHLYRNLGSIESTRHLTHWLRKVATHRSIDRVRQAKLSRPVALEAVPEPAAAPNESDPILSGKLERLVAGLPPRPRMVVVLRFQEELEPAEIAEILGIPVGTVKSCLHRALALLRAKMQRQEKEAVR